MVGHDVGGAVVIGRRWIADGGHAWLVVPMREARTVPGLSHYSYVSPSGTVAYLEEDCDAPRYLAHYGIEPATVPVGEYYDGDAPCRRYRPYPEGVTV